MRRIKFTSQQITNIINEYTQNNKSTRQLGTEYNVSKSVIARVLKENNIALDHINRKYFGDYRKFQNIDIPEKAYWLGFIAADGCNYWREENASLVISIGRKDRSHLEKFRLFMNTNADIKDFINTSGFSNDNQEMCKIVLNSKDLSNDLTDKGIVPHKSLILKPPKIDEQFFLPFILGYFDGDGSLFKTQQNIYGINFVGTKEMLEWINDILQITTHLEQKKGYEEKNNFYIRCGGTNKPYNILKQLYNSCDVHLDRKYNLFLELETVVHNRNIM
jgi:hypothetical protein